MSQHFLPYVGSAATIAPQGELDKARQIFELMKTHPEQGRKGMAWNDKLMFAAQAKCEAQAKQGWTGHVDPDGYGPNWLVRQFLYRLPDRYSKKLDANNCESLAHNGDGSVDGVWQAWLQSEGHRIHLLGENAFYAGQTNVGVGYYFLESSEKKHYWAILTAHPEMP